MNFKFTTYIERNDEDIEVRVTYRASAFVAATHFQPAEGPEVELIATQYADGSPMSLTDAEESKIHDECEARVSQDFAEAYADAEDYRAEAARDDRMIGEME